MKRQIDEEAKKQIEKDKYDYSKFRAQEEQCQNKFRI
jgi:hypothetical protein